MAKMKKEDVEALATLLEKTGLENSLDFIEEKLIPFAIKEKWSLCKTLNKYADAFFGDDPHSKLVYIAFKQINYSDLLNLNIHEVVTKKPS